MKTIFYGNNQKAMEQVEELVEELIIQLDIKETEETCINSHENSLSIDDVIGEGNPSGFDLVVFIGTAPIEEVKSAVEHGIKVLILLAPTEIPLMDGVMFGSTKKLSDRESLESDFLTILQNVA